jgi:SAF domain
VGRLRIGGRPRLGSGVRRTLRLRYGRYRRALGVVLLLAVTWVTVRAASPDQPVLARVLVAVRDLPAGASLSTGDVRAAAWPVSALPTGRLTSASGRILASPVRMGEPLTDARVLGPGLLTGLTLGTVAVPVRLSDPSIGRLVRTGDRVSVLTAANASGWSAASYSGPTPSLPDGTETDAGTGGCAANASCSVQDPSGDSLAGSVHDPVGGVLDPPSPGSGSVRQLVGSALVLAAPGGSAGTDETGGLGGLGLTASGSGTDAGGNGDDLSGVLLLAVTPTEARRLTAAQPNAFIGITILPNR